MLGSSIKQAIKEAFIWLFGIILIVCLIVYWNEIKYGLSGAIQLAEDQYKTHVTSSEPRSNSSRTGFERRFIARANHTGHFNLEGNINGYTVAFLADTGATYVALSYKDADRLGLSPHTLNFSGRSKTANGIARVAPVVLDRLSVGDITVKNVQALVSEPGK
ncbi:MAG: TIGR02281 family clan AA aspartic protease, partial [Pseudomonadota bacterium]